MKILIDARMYGTVHTGIGRYVQNLIENLQKLDKTNNYLILLRSEDFKSLRFNKNFKKVEADFRHYSLKEQTLLPKLLKSLDYDLAHFPHFNVPLLTKKPFVVTIHDMIMHKKIGKNATTHPTLLYELKHLGYLKVFKAATKNSKKIIVPSENVKEDLIKKLSINESKILRIYEGVDDLVKPADSKKSKYKAKYKKLLNTKYFIYAGNVYPHKNINRLVEAFKFLLDEGKFDAKLVIVTKNNNFKQELKRFVNKNNIKKVLFYSNIPDDELGYLYSNSIAFIYPSLEEGFGLQGLEAVANNTLLACSDIPVFREIYERKAIYFNPHDFSSIQTTMFNILNMKLNDRKKLIVKQKEILKNYSLEKMAKETLKVYNSFK